MTDPARLDPDDPARRPRSFGERLKLLLILLILPVTAVTLPTIFVTGIFGQKPKPKIAAAATADGLGEALNRSAVSLLPTPAPLTPEPIRIKVRPDRVGARAEKILIQAQALGGSAIEGLSDPGEKHLYIDLPAGRGAIFQQAVTMNSTPPSPMATPPAGAARDQLEVIIHGDEDE